MKPGIYDQRDSVEPRFFSASSAVLWLSLIRLLGHWLARLFPGR